LDLYYLLVFRARTGGAETQRVSLPVLEHQVEYSRNLVGFPLLGRSTAAAPAPQPSPNFRDRRAHGTGLSGVILQCGRSLGKFPQIVVQAKEILERFMNALSCIDQCFIADSMLDELPIPSRVGITKTKVREIDLNKPRMRWVVEAVIALCLSLSLSPHGFTASELARQVRMLSNQAECQYDARRAAYDLKKLRGKKIVHRIGQTRRYQSTSSGLKAMVAFVVFANFAVKRLINSAQTAAAPHWPDTVPA
jgi:hypothetical protein